MGMKSLGWVAVTLGAGLVLPGCCSTCGMGSCWGGKTGSAAASNRPLPPATYPGAPSGMANRMTPPPGAAAGTMQPMQTIQPAGYNQPAGMTTNQPPSNFQPFTPAQSTPQTPVSGAASPYSKPVGYSRTQTPTPGDSPLMDAPPPVQPAGGFEPPPPTAPSMPPGGSTSTSATEAPIIPPGPPSAPGE